jgi:hypothetical protein
MSEQPAEAEAFDTHPDDGVEPEHEDADTSGDEIPDDLSADLPDQVIDESGAPV